MSSRMTMVLQVAPKPALKVIRYVGVPAEMPRPLWIDFRDRHMQDAPLTGCLSLKCGRARAVTVQVVPPLPVSSTSSQAAAGAEVGGSRDSVAGRTQDSLSPSHSQRQTRQNPSLGPGCQDLT